LLEFTRTLRIVDGADAGAHGGRLGLDIQTDNLQGDPGTNAVIVARGIAASMQIDAGGDGAFHERLAEAVLPEDDERDGALDASAAARFFSHGMIGRADQRRLAHVCSRK
jgi:hypothetical protein